MVFTYLFHAEVTRVKVDNDFDEEYLCSLCCNFFNYLCLVFISIYRMRYVAAYLLAVLGGNDKPTDKDIKKILSSVGIDADADSINKVINELKGKAVEDVIKAGK